MEPPVFRYIRWAKKWAGVATYDLTGSSAPPLRVPPVDGTEHRRMPTGDGDPVCENHLAGHLGVPRDEVLFVSGSTLANYLLAALHVRPGDRVLVETPAYENLPGLVRLLGAELVPLPRPPEDGFQPDPERVATAVEDGVRFVLLTDLHNPSGVRLETDRLEAIRAAARAGGARVILDEVYRDFLPGEAGTGYRAGDATVLVTSSLTKVYGLGSLRAGWILAPKEVRERAVHLLDFLTVLPCAPGASAAEIVLEEIADRRKAARRAADDGRALFHRWAEARGDVRCVPPAGGVVCFPRLEGIEDTAILCDWLREERDTMLVPGRFFGAAAHVRLGTALPPGKLEEALARVGEGIDRFRG